MSIECVGRKIHPDSEVTPPLLLKNFALQLCIGQGWSMVTELEYTVTGRYFRIKTRLCQQGPRVGWIVWDLPQALVASRVCAT